MSKTVDVNIGQVKVAKGKVILTSTAIGSCVGIVAYDVTRKIGALAHVMLPGWAPKGRAKDEKTKYTGDAIEAIVSQMTKLGSRIDDIQIAVVGGANVLQRKDDTISEDNIESTFELLQKYNLKVRAKAVGGTVRRSVSLDIESGKIYFSEADEAKKLLWEPEKNDQKSRAIGRKQQNNPHSNSFRNSILAY